jgi:hypothetical protein
MPVGELLDRMSSAELTEWAALFKIEAEEATHQNKVSQSRSKVRRR